MADYDLLIRGGTVVDGTQVPRCQADVAIKDGHVAQIGGLRDASADRELDAGGAIVAPGFVDLHTHYDAQIQWDPWCSISGWHGVTSVVVGNCGFGFAPVRPEERDRAMLMMSRTEAIPFDSMKAGMLWDWETFPEWLDTLDRIPKGVNCLSYMPISPLMIWSMGLDAAKSRGATDDERMQMQQLLDEAMDAGACGWSVQRLGENSLQADYDGTPMVTDTMRDEEVWALAQVLKQRDEGFVQITQGTGDVEYDRYVVERIAEISGRPVLYNVLIPRDDHPELYQSCLRWIEDCNKRGLRIFAQSLTVRGPFAFTLEDWNLYDAAPGWNRALTGTIDEKREKIADAELRAQLVEESDTNKILSGAVGGPIAELVLIGTNDHPELMSLEGRELGDIAREQGKHPVETMLDLALDTDMKATFQTGNGAADNPDFSADLVSAPWSIPGVSDGGAHTKFLTSGSYTTDLLTWIVRDEERLSLEEAHYRLSYLPAHAAGFKDRGYLREGAPADIVIYDLEKLRRIPEWTGEVVHDLPAGEWRRVQRSEGYRWTIVNGAVTFEDSECTGATPGKLLRHGRAD